MRTTIAGMLLATALATAAPAGAQDPAQVAKIPPRVRAEMQTDFMNKKLNLTPDEKTKIEAINLKYADQMQPVLQGSMGPLERMRAVKKIEEAKDGEVKAVLTAEQYQAYVASKDELREKIKQRALSEQ